MNKIVVILLLLITNVCLAQVKLNEKFVSRKADSTLIKELIMYTQEEKDSATQFLHEVYGLSISNELKDKTGISFFNYRLALKAKQSNYWSKAEQYLINASKELNGEAILESINSEFLNCYKAQGKYKEYAELLFKIYNTTKEDKKKNELYDKLKELYIANNLDSLKHQNLFKISLSRGDELFIAKNLFQTGLKDSAVNYLNLVLDSSNNKVSSIQKLQAKVLYARYYRESKDLKKALEIISPVITLADSLKEHTILTEALTEYGKICFAQKQLPACLSAFSKSLSSARLSNNQELVKSQLTFLVNFYNAIGKTNIAKLYNDTLTIIAPIETMQNVGIDVTEQNLNFDKALQKCYEILIKKPEEKSDPIFNIGFLFVFVGLAIVLLIVLIFIYLKKRPKIVKEEVIVEKELPAKEIIKEVFVEVSSNKPNDKLRTIYKSLDLNTNTIAKVLRGSFISELEDKYNVFAWLADLRLSRTAPQRGIFLAFADNVLIGEDAAYYNIQLNDYLNKIVKEKNILQPSAILNHLNRAIVEFNSNKNQNWKSKLAFCFVNADSTELLFAGASLNISIIRNAKVYDIKSDEVILGDIKTDFQFQDNSVGIAKGDVIVVTDCNDVAMKQKVNAIIIEELSLPENKASEKIQTLLKVSSNRACVMVV